MKIPKSWNEITISQFQECYFILGKTPDIDSWVKVISVLSGRSCDEIESIPLKDLTKCIYSLNFLLKPNLEEKVKKYVLVNKKIYKAIYQATDLNTAQGHDLKTFLEPNGLDFQDTVVENAHKLLATIYLPLKWRGFKYNGGKHAQIAEDFKHAKMGDVYGTLFFYSVVYKNLMQTMEACGNEALQVTQEHMKEVVEWAIQEKILEKDGAGKLQLTKSAEATLS